MNFISFFVLLFVSFTVSIILTPVFKRLGIFLGATDNLKELGIHSKPQVRFGGGVLVVGLICGVAFAFLFLGLDFHASKEVFGILISAFIVAIVGIVEDIRGIRNKSRFTLQLLACIPALICGINWEIVPYKILGFLVAIFYLVGGANSMNFLDGMDGLAVGVSAIASFFFFCLGAMERNFAVMAVACSLLGTCIGFLFHNFYPARVFMGDGGSLYLGFLLSGLALMFSKLYDIGSFLGPVFILGLPASDAFLAMRRRFILGSKIFTGDRMHIYDTLHLHNGIGYRNTVIIVWSVSFILGVIGILIYKLNTPISLMIVFICMAILAFASMRLGLWRTK